MDDTRPVRWVASTAHRPTAPHLRLTVDTAQRGPRALLPLGAYATLPHPLFSPSHSLHPPIMPKDPQQAVIVGLFVCTPNHTPQQLTRRDRAGRDPQQGPRGQGHQAARGAGPRGQALCRACSALLPMLRP